MSKKNFIDFLRKGFVSGEKTLIEDVNKIKPGQYIKFNLSNGNLISKNFFNLPFYQNKNFKNIQINNLQNEFKNLLTKSVKNQIYADVPVGILLSGGIDSSLITALAAEENSKINTYTFLNNINDKNDFELKNSRLISDYFSTNHLEIYYPDIKVTILDELMKFLDDPIIDSSLIPTYLITKEIKKYCTVALGGDGGDELFGGYDHYSRLLKLSKFNKFLPKSLREIISKKLIQYLPTGFRGKNWFNLMGKDLSNEYLDFAVYFDHLNYRHIINEKYLDKFNDLKKNNEQNFFCEDLIFKASQQDFHNFLVEDILVKTDRTSMANSLELRCPYLDKDIINFAFKEIPSSLKVNAYNKKIFLKKLASKILPRNFELNKKRGFSIPIATFFENEKWLNTAKDILLEKNSLFNTRSVSNIIKKPFFNHNNSERIFGLLIFELWRKKYNVSL